MNKIIRVKNKDYTTISNVFLRDERLSLKAKGLLALVMSLPDDWDFSVKGLCAIVKESVTAIYTAIDELKEFGYCSVEQVRNEKGVIQGNDYTFIENPHLGFPHVDNPRMENQTQINKDITKTLNEEKEIEKSISKKRDENFETCWIAYRRKGSKKKAKEYWNKLSEKEKKMVLPHIRAYVASRDIQYQKDFERYLRDKVFETFVFSRDGVAFDPSSLDGTTYAPTTDGAISWNDYYNCYMYIGYWDGRNIADGYDDTTRPNGASITLNNGRGVIVWNSNNKVWENKNQCTK